MCCYAMHIIAVATAVCMCLISYVSANFGPAALSQPSCCLAELVPLHAAVQYTHHKQHTLHIIWHCANVKRICWKCSQSTLCHGLTVSTCKVPHTPLDNVRCFCCQVAFKNPSDGSLHSHDLGQPMIAQTCMAALIVVA